MLARNQLFESANVVFERDEPALKAGKLFCNVERLRKETLNLPRARDSQFVIFRQLVDSQNCDYVLQILVALKYAFYVLSNLVMFLTNYSWIENSRSGGERIDGRIDSQLCYLS